MRTVVGNVFDFPGAICVPTNVGWKKDGTNVMGRGVAAQAAVIYPELPSFYGRFCQLHSQRPYPVAVFMQHGAIEYAKEYICVPVVRDHNEMSPA